MALHADLPTLGAIPSGLPMPRLPAFPLEYLPAMLVSAGEANWICATICMPVLVHLRAAASTKDLHLMHILLFAVVLAVLGAIDSLLTSLVADSLTSDFHDSDKELRGVCALIRAFNSCCAVCM